MLLDMDISVQDVPIDLSGSREVVPNKRLPILYSIAKIPLLTWEFGCYRPPATLL